MSAHPVLRPDAPRDLEHDPPPSLRLARRPTVPRFARRVPHRGTVARPRLVRPLLDDAQAVAALLAPAGYGKTTLLAEWCAQDPRPFAWVDATPELDDPARLLETVAAALCDVRPLPADVLAPSVTVEHLARVLATMRPLVLVLDDLHVLRTGAARRTVATLAQHMPAGSTLAIAARRDPGLPLGRLRAQDDVVELGAEVLAMTRGESAAVLRQAGLRLTGEQQADLLERTAGWPAGLRLAARALAEQHDVAAGISAFAGDDAVVADYVRQEILADLAGADRAFLTRVAVLERLAGPVCDAVLGRHDSGARLARLRRAGVPLTPLDRAETEFRLHPLLAQALRRDLERADASLAHELHGRASAWYEHEGDLDLAVEHALLGRDADRVADLLAERAPALVGSGRCATLDGWLHRIGEAEVAQRPVLALAAALSRIACGQRDEAERWAVEAVHGSASAPPAARRTVDVGIAVVWAAIGRDGVETMTGDAALAHAGAQVPGAWGSLACLLEGSGHLLAGRADEARACLDDGARRAVSSAPLVRSLCLAQLGFLALQDGDLEEAAALTATARAAMGAGDGAYPLAAFTFAVDGLTLALRGRHDVARRNLDEAQRRLAALPDAAPWYAALVRVVVARAELRLSDAETARRLLHEASRLHRSVGDAVALRTWIDEAWALADDYAAGPVACPSVLTRAELRVLRLLPSHLTFAEIAARLHLSPNTVKTQAHAVYRKLDASSRSEAVAHARAMGLVDAEFTRSG